MYVFIYNIHKHVIKCEHIIVVRSFLFKNTHGTQVEVGSGNSLQLTEHDSLFIRI